MTPEPLPPDSPNWPFHKPIELNHRTFIAMRLLSFLVPLFLLPVALLAEKPAKDPLADLKHPTKACLWKVEGNGLTKPSWLFGTIHLGDPRVTNLHPRAEKAFSSLDIFYGEIDMNPAAQVALAAKMIRKDGKTLSEALGPELTRKLDIILKKINPALGAEVFQTLKTWVVAISLPMLEMQLEQEEPLDSILQARAAKAGKKTDALETADSQIQVFEQFKENEQQVFLSDTIKMLQEDIEAGTSSVKKLTDIYLTSTAKGIGDYVKNEMARMKDETDLNKRLMKALLDDRNIKMAEKANEFMQGARDQSHFFAVGAAHYTGKTAVQKLLKKKGYTIKPAFK